MKTKNLLHATLLFALVLIFNACSGTFTIDLLKQEEVNSVKERIIKFISENDIILKLDFGSTSQGFSSDMEQVTVTYFDMEANEVKAKIIPLGKKVHESNIRNWTPSFSEKKLTAEDGVKLADLDLSNVSSNIEKAQAVLATEDINLPYSGVGSYDIILNNDYPQSVLL